jgi:exosortase
MAERWANDPQYSHGFLVPVFGLVVLWSRRAYLPRLPLQPSWWGAAWLAAALLLHLAGGYLFVAPLDGLALLAAVAGMVLLVGGRAALRWSWPAVAFLAFMLPLPYQVETALAHPLRRTATDASTYVLQTFGLPAFAEGNIIVMDDLRLGVIDACSGLGMLMTFFALATAVALLIDRPVLDRLVLVASAIPIALLANVARITATAFAHRLFGADTAHILFHDLAGWLMMPLAMALLLLEAVFLARLLPATEEARPVPLTFPAGPVAAPHTARAAGPDRPAAHRAPAPGTR